MRKLYIITLLLLITSFGVQAQKDTDIYMANYSVSFGILPIQVTGTTNTANNYSYPIYRRTDTTGIGMNFLLHIGGNFPLIRTENWSIGAKINAGAGRQGSLKAAEGLEGYTLDFPEYIYYRNYRTALDFSLLAGIKHSRGVLNYTLPMVAVDININDNSLRFYSSVQRYTYYSYYSNGDVKPFLKIGEHGIMCTFRIGGG